MTTIMRTGQPLARALKHTTGPSASILAGFSQKQMCRAISMHPSTPRSSYRDALSAEKAQSTPQISSQGAFSSSRRQQDTTLSEQRRQATEKFVGDKAEADEKTIVGREKTISALRQDLESQDSVAISATVEQLGAREAAIKTFIEKDNLEKDGDLKAYVEKTKLGKDQELNRALRGATYEEVKPLITYYRQKLNEASERAKQKEKEKEEEKKKDYDNIHQGTNLVVAFVAVIFCVLGAMAGPLIIPFVVLVAALLVMGLI